MFEILETDFPLDEEIPTSKVVFTKGNASKIDEYIKSILQKENGDVTIFQKRFLYC